MMNQSTGKVAIFSFTGKLFQLHAALFHSTPVLNRKRRNIWDDIRPSRSNYSSRRSRRLSAKHSLLRNLNAYADYIFHGWMHDDEEFTRGPYSWFANEYKGRSRRSAKSNSQGNSHKGRGTFNFCEEEYETEKIFRGSKSNSYWSFVNEEDLKGSHNPFRTWWRHKVEDESYHSAYSECQESELVSERLALGLQAYGPLKLEDVKNAYRACALKWHPDRHHGSFKAVAEEKFKLCGTAYKSLCDKLSAS